MCEKAENGTLTKRFMPYNQFIKPLFIIDSFCKKKLLAELNDRWSFKP